MKVFAACGAELIRFSRLLDGSSGRTNYKIRLRLHSEVYRKREESARPRNLFPVRAVTNPSEGGTWSFLVPYPVTIMESVRYAYNNLQARPLRGVVLMSHSS